MLIVDQYTDCFHELTIRSKVVENKQQTLARYCMSLCNELQKEMLITRHLKRKGQTYKQQITIL